MTHAAPSQAISAGSTADMKLICLAVVPRTHFKWVSDKFALYWVHYGDDVDEKRLLDSLRDVLTDPLQEELWHASPSERQKWMERWKSESYHWWAERQFLPGVTDNLGHTVQEALTLKGCPSTIRVAPPAPATCFNAMHSQHKRKL